MKTEMSSFDILAIVQELVTIEGSRINKAFQTGKREVKLQLGGGSLGRRDLLIEAGRRLHLTEYPRPSPKTPTTFAMTLRKHLANGRIREIRQVAFDRIVEIWCENRGEEFRLIAELFGKGNLLLTDGENRILAVLFPQAHRDRRLTGKSQYVYPPQRTDPFTLSDEEIQRAVQASRGDLVRTLATVLGLGGLYAEEVCLRAGVEKGKEEITRGEARAVSEALREMREEVGKGKPSIFYRDGRPIDLAPFPLRVYEGLERKEFLSFNRALDEYFTHQVLEGIEAEREDRFRGEIQRLENRLEEQGETLERYRKEEALFREMGDLLYAHFRPLETLLKTLARAKRDHSWEEIAERLEEGKGKIPELERVRKILPERGEILVELDGREVPLDIRKTLPENANRFYERGKKAREKAVGAAKAIEETEAKIAALRQKGKEGTVPRDESLPRKRPREGRGRKRAWYERFRWFRSSDGLLVLGGRDATSNEVLVKRHLEKGDLFVHAEIHGAPAVVIKAGGKGVPERTLQEAYDFAATYSRAWKHGIPVLKVYHVAPEQVSKTAEHGEFVAKGAFIIRGKKNYGTGRVALAIGAHFKDGEVRILGGPPSAIAEKTEIWVEIQPGREKASALARAIREELLGKAGDGEREALEKIDLDEIVAFLPSGGGAMKGKGSRPF
jgi:predicted ribosome quality control (RQC) complex YloA/Tae2 family protein